MSLTGSVFFFFFFFSLLFFNHFFIIFYFLGYDDDIEGEYSAIDKAYEKKGEKIIAKNATGRRMIKILKKQINDYMISLETPLKHFPILIPTVIS